MKVPVWDISGPCSASYIPGLVFLLSLHQAFALKPSLQGAFGIRRSAARDGKASAQPGALCVLSDVSFAGSQAASFRRLFPSFILIVESSRGISDHVLLN